MYALLSFYLFVSALAPLNPLEQDTVSSTNLHASFGIDCPTGDLATGPSFSLKYEMLVIHPWVIRSGVDFRFGSVDAYFFPTDEDNRVTIHGKALSTTISVEGFYYRGTNHITGFIGLGVVYGFHNFSPKDKTRDELLRTYNIDQIGMRQRFGYRFVTGLRFHRVYSLELSITEINPQFSYKTRVTEGYSSGVFPTKFSGVHISIGRLWSIGRR